MGCCFSVGQAEIAVLERWGRFNRMCEAGLNFKWPIGEEVIGRLDTRVKQTWIKVDTKSRDNVFVHISAAVQYRVVDDKLYEAMYRLREPAQAIRAATINALRSFAPTLTLDELFLERDRMAMTVLETLTEAVRKNGYEVLQVLVVDISPDESVKQAMNNVNTQERLRAAALHQAEARKTTEIMKAEADAERKRLSGVGLALKRQALMEGLHESLLEFTASVPGVDTREVMNLLMMGQHFDAMVKTAGRPGHVSETLVQCSPATVKTIREQIRVGLAERRPAVLHRLLRDDVSSDAADTDVDVGVGSSARNTSLIYEAAAELADVETSKSV